MNDKEWYQKDTSYRFLGAWIPVKQERIMVSYSGTLEYTTCYEYDSSYSV